jgi:ligand-binding sensor domain-containing protein
MEKLQSIKFYHYKSNHKTFAMKKLTYLLLVYTLLFISKTNAQTFTNYTVLSTSTSICNNMIFSIAIDTEENIWFGTLEGVSKFDGTDWINYTTANGLAGNSVHAIAIDAEGNKWFGTDQSGVFKFDNTTWTNYTFSDGLAANGVLAIAIDSLGNKWFGTLGGVSKFDGTNWTTYTTEDGLANYAVISIAIDADGSIWFGTDGGVSKLSADSTRTIIKKIKENHLNIYPNPVQNVLHINLSGETGALQIFDISGKCLLQKQITGNERTVDVSGLEEGIYIIKVIYDNKIFTGKVVKN